MRHRLSTWALAAFLVFATTTEAPTAGAILTFALGAIGILAAALLLLTSFDLIWERRGER